MVKVKNPLVDKPSRSKNWLFSKVNQIICKKFIKTINNIGVLDLNTDLNNRQNNLKSTFLGEFGGKLCGYNLFRI